MSLFHRISSFTTRHFHLHTVLLVGAAVIVGGLWVRNETPTFGNAPFPNQKQLEQSYVILPPDKVAKFIPGLKGIRPPSDQTELPIILAKVGQNVAAFFGMFPNTSSEELVHMARLHMDGSVDESITQQFRYLALGQSGHAQSELLEYRTNSKGEPVRWYALRGAYVITQGFISSLIHFAVLYQSDSVFRDLGSVMWQGRLAEVVAFAQRPDRARQLLGALSENTSTRVCVQGLAWIDPTTDEILMMRTDLLQPQREIGLERETTQVELSEVKFKDPPLALWLPSRVIVTIVWNSQMFQNIHTYSNYRIFKVQTQEKVGIPDGRP